MVKKAVGFDVLRESHLLTLSLQDTCPATVLTFCVIVFNERNTFVLVIF